MKAGLLAGLAAAGLAGLAAAAAERVSYDGYKVVRVSVGDEEERVRRVVADLGLATWKGAPQAGGLADIVVPPHQVEAFDSRMAGLAATTMHADLGASIAAEAGSAGSYAAGSANMTWFHSYHGYKDHMQFLGDLIAAHPNNSELVTSGSSLNGRPITGIHIFGSAGKAGRPAVVFHGTVHAREWISTMTVEYLAYQLLTGYEAEGEGSTAALVDALDFYVFPVVNPDGFLFTQASDRLWRKNRQTSTLSDCVGRDINRNWPFQWAVEGGGSLDPCAQDYKGVRQGDAPETAALAAWMQAVKNRQGLKLYIDFHAYAQYFMTPYGYTCTATPRNSDELLELAQGAVDAMNAVHNTFYQAGPICNMLYRTTGNSVDYVNDVVGADYSFTLELRDQGQNGFVLPPAQILPTGEETYAGVRHLLANMK